MPPGFNFTINVIFLSKYNRNLNASNITARYPNENAADIALQASYWQNIHGAVNSNTPSNGTEL